MDNPDQTYISFKKLPIFFIIVLILSIPFYYIATTVPDESVLLVGLPMTMAPIIAGLIMAYRENGMEGAKSLLKRAFDFKRITDRNWYLPILLFWPVLFIAGYGIFLVGGGLAPETLVPLVSLPIVFILFLILALFEEVGWMGYAYEPMENQWRALGASLFLGVIWAFWHLPLYLQFGLSQSWVIGQVVSLVAVRILIVWIFNNAGKSVFAAILFHAVYNLGPMFVPSFSTDNGHLIYTVLIVSSAVLVMLLWDSETLARFRFRRAKG